MGLCGNFVILHLLRLLPHANWCFTFSLEQESSKPTNSCEKGEFQVEQTEENIQAANKRGSSEGTVLCQITEKDKILASRGPQQRTVETMAEPTSFSLGTGHGKQFKLTLEAKQWIEMNLILSLRNKAARMAPWRTMGLRVLRLRSLRRLHFISGPQVHWLTIHNFLSV